MKQREKMILTFGLIISAYAYAFAGYEAAAGFLAVSAAVCAAEAHSLRCLKKHVLTILWETVLLALVYSSLDRAGMITVLPFVGMMNVLSAEVFAESSVKAYGSFVPGILYVMLGMLAAALVIPASVMDFFLYGYGGRFEACVMILSIFLPLLKVYAQKILRKKGQMKAIAFGRELR